MAKRRRWIIILMRVVYDMSVTMRYCGYAIVDIDETILSAQFKGMDSRQTGDFVVFNSRNRPLIFSSASILSAARFYISSHSNSDAKVKLRFAGDTYICSKRKLDKSRLSIVHLTNIDDARAKFYTISRILIIICLSRGD